MAMGTTRESVQPGQGGNQNPEIHLVTKILLGTHHNQIEPEIGRNPRGIQTRKKEKAIRETSKRRERRQLASPQKPQKRCKRIHSSAPVGARHTLSYVRDRGQSQALNTRYRFERVDSSTWSIKSRDTGISIETLRSNR